MQMGKVLKKLGRQHEALASFNHALDLDPKSANIIKAHIDRLQVQLPREALKVAQRGKRARMLTSYHACADSL